MFYLFNEAYDYSFAGCINYSSSVIENNLDFFINGAYIKSGQDPEGFSIIHTNAMGDTIWQKYYPDSFNVFSPGASQSLIRTIDSNYIMCGDATRIINNQMDAHLAKFNGSGDTLWTKTYGGTGNDHFNTLIETPEDSGLTLIGYTTSYGQGQSDFYMVHTDKNGNQQWYKTYGSGSNEGAIGAVRALDGGYYISGNRGNLHWLVKADINGNHLWNRIFSGSSNTMFVSQMSDSNLILAGAKQINGLDWQGWLAKTDKNGNIIWENTYGGTTAEILYTKPIVLSDGSIVCAGTKNYGNIPYGWLLKTDANGNQQWERSYYKNQNIDNYFYDVKQTSDGGFVMSGTCYVTNADAWLVKVDSNGCEVLNCNVGQEELSLDNAVISIYPNPSTGVFTIKTDAKNYSVEIYNMMGQVIMVAENKTDIDLSAEPKGIYFVMVMENEKYYLQKIVIE